MSKVTGKALNKEWGIGAQHALYREDGLWYHVLRQFPAALCDAHGYIVFRSEDEYKHSPGVSVGETKNWTHVAGGIATLPGYVRVK